jgi:16S rRNA (guanine527-N7)-methyltransferase
VIFAHAELFEGLRAAGIGESPAQQIAAFGAYLLDVNCNLNLTGADSPEELLPHIIDSLSVVPYLRGRYVDVGSGGGLPAIPAAIAAGVDLTMVEAITKKAVFLESALTHVGLSGRVIPDRAEAAGRAPELREQFDCATARAVATAPTVLEYVSPLLRVGGSAILQRGALPDAERNAVTDAALVLGCRVEQEIPIGGERRLLIIKKVEGISNRFPRRTGIPEKRPLCF